MAGVLYRRGNPAPPAPGLVRSCGCGIIPAGAPRPRRVLRQINVLRRRIRMKAGRARPLVPEHGPPWMNIRGRRHS